VPGNQGLSSFGPGFIVPFCCNAFTCNKVNVVVVVLPSSAMATVKVNIFINSTPTAHNKKDAPTIFANIGCI
jgi:hypothetical protein